MTARRRPPRLRNVLVDVVLALLTGGPGAASAAWAPIREGGSAVMMRLALAVLVVIAVLAVGVWLVLTALT